MVVASENLNGKLLETAENLRMWQAIENCFLTNSPFFFLVRWRTTPHLGLRGRVLFLEIVFVGQREVFCRTV